MHKGNMIASEISDYARIRIIRSKNSVITKPTELKETKVHQTALWLFQSSPSSIYHCNIELGTSKGRKVSLIIICLTGSQAKTAN